MKKLKIILWSNLLTIILGLIVIIFVLYNYNKDLSKYDEGNNTIMGTIIDYKKEDNYYKLTIKAKEVIIGNYYGNLDIKIGNKYKISGNVSIPKENTNFNGFNYKKYLKGNKIFRTIKIDKMEYLSYNNLYLIKNVVKEHIEKSINKDYLYAFILGNSNYLDDGIKESYNINTTSHLLAVSGMHINFIVLLLSFIFKSKGSKIFISFFLIFYAYLIGFNPSVVRSVGTYVITSITNIKALKALILVFLLMFLYNPFYYYNIGFLFSFIITFSLIIYKFKDESYLINSLIVSTIANLVSMPIVIYNFNSINILGILNNLIFVPIISMVVFPLSIFSFFLPLDNILKIILDITNYLSLLIASNKLELVFMKPHLLVIVIYYLFIILTLKYKKPFILVIVIIHLIYPYYKNETTITYLDVGQGDSIVNIINNKVYVIDTGGSKYYDTSKTVSSYIKSKGYNKIDYLIITHGDLDHIGGSFNLIKQIKVKNVVFNKGTFNDLELKLIKELKKNNINYHKEEDIYPFKVLKTTEYNNENDNSIVLYLNLNNLKFLFMGDAGKKVEEEVIRNYNLNHIDFLKVGHHGSDTSSSDYFINTIKPKYSIISVGKNNKFGHPKDEVLDTLKNSKIYRTDIDGSIEIKLNKNGYMIKICTP